MTPVAPPAGLAPELITALTGDEAGLAAAVFAGAATFGADGAAALLALAGALLAAAGLLTEAAGADFAGAALTALAFRDAPAPLLTRPSSFTFCAADPV